MSPGRPARLAFLLFLAILALAYSNSPPGDPLERVRAFSRPLEFDYISWTLQAAGVKVGQLSLGASQYLPPESRRQQVLAYLELVGRIRELEHRLNEIYADPGIADPQAASAAERRQLQELYARRSRQGPLAESILQSQMSQVVAELGLSLGGQPVPPILFHSSSLPTALIVSPRHAIRQDANISLQPEMTADERAALEAQVDSALNVSSLVVDIGGIGVYPTMVVQTNDLNYLTEVVAHEWAHNYLSLRPLGINYMANPALRTMNETAAGIAGKEIGRAVMERYYPQLLPPPPAPPAEAEEPQPPAFDFRAEMHATRVTVDRLLAEGQVEQAEAYMEVRRLFFWENGYHIRKLNQAYFAFYGAYAEEPGGPAGEDPVGAAVRALRARSPSLAAFIRRIAWLSSFEQLQRAVEEASS